MAAYRLSKKAIKNSSLAILGILVLVACLLGLNEFAALFGSGFIGLFVYYMTKSKRANLVLAPFVLFELSKIGSLKIFLSFLKIGAILYGSGYVLFAFLNTELVEKGWLSSQELIDAVAVGQFTPGPVLSTATFIGWQMNGISGALAATIGIFLPSFLFVLILNPLIKKMRSSKPIGAVLDAVNVAAVALIVAVCIEMGKATLVGWKTTLIAVLSLIIVFVFKKLNSAFIVLGSAILGYLLSPCIKP